MMLLTTRQVCEDRRFTQGRSTSFLMGRLAVLGVRETSTPIRLGRHVIHSEALRRQGSANPTYDPGLGGDVGMTQTGLGYNLGERLDEERRITGLGTTDPVKPTNVDLTGLPRSEPLFVSGGVDLEQGRGHRAGWQDLEHRQRSRHARLVGHEEMPIGILTQGDLAPRADGIDPISGPSRTNPISTRSCAMQRDVDADCSTTRIEVRDGVATLHDSVVGERYPQHQVLPRPIAEVGEAGGGEEHPTKGRGQRARLNHLEVEEGGVGQRPARNAHQVQEPISRHVRDVYQEVSGAGSPSSVSSSRVARAEGFNRGTLVADAITSSRMQTWTRSPDA